MNFKRLAWLTAFLLSATFAAPITIIYTSSGSGSIGSTTFTNATFTITELLDTANRQSFLGGYSVDDTSASIAIAGVGTFNFTTTTRSFVNNLISLAGFSRGGVNGSDLLYASANAVLGTWDLTTSIGPITGTGQLLQWATPTISTSGGTLTFSNNRTTTTFQATVGTATPEPSAVSLAWLGLAGISWMIRRRRVPL